MLRMLLAILVFGTAYALPAQTGTLGVAPLFQPVEARSVTDIPSKNPCAVPGTVVLNALITETGKVQDVEVRRDIACFTQVAVQAVEDWRFAPATFGGKVIVSRMPVAVTFESQTWAPNPFPLPKLVPQTAAAIQAAFQPAEVTRAAFPPFHPGYTLTEGTVVLEVALSAKGDAEEIKVLRDLPPFTANAKAVLEDWRFMPATFNGHPVRSKILLAFVSPPFVSTRR